MALGAFGAHGLKARLSAEMLAVWHTAVLNAAAWLLAAGILLFSASLYALAIGVISARTPA